MPVVTSYISLETEGDYQMADITARVAQKVRESKLKDGVVTLFVVGSTAALTTIEYESGLVQDMEDLFDRILPAGKSYHHDQKWHDGNGHSHIRASLLGPSLSVPFVAGDLTLGTWQQIVFVDFDVPPRNRKIVVQIVGETS